MKLKFNKYILIPILIIIGLIVISFYKFYKPYYNFIDDYNTIKENCYEKKNVNHYVCKLPYYQDENNLKHFIENNDPYKGLKELDLYTVYNSIVENETYSVLQFLSPLLIMIMVVGTLHQEYSSGMFKNYLTRQSYKSYLKDKYKFVLAISLIIPFSLIVILLVSGILTGFNTKIASSVYSIAVYSEFKYNHFFMYFIGFLFITYFMSAFYANIGLFCIKKTKNTTLAIIMGYILFLIIDIIIYVVIYAFILYKFLNLNVSEEIFNITGYFFTDTKINLIKMLLVSFILQGLSTFILYKFYQNKQEVIENSEKQNA